MEELLSEALLHDVVDLLVRFVETAGAVVIVVGAAISFVRFVGTALRTRSPAEFVPIRLNLGRFLALGLEFQLAGDILKTAIAPTFEEIGQLAAIAAIRTALNYFLGREIKEERAELDRAEREATREPDQAERDRQVREAHVR